MAAVETDEISVPKGCCCMNSDQMFQGIVRLQCDIGQSFSVILQDSEGV